MGSNVLGFDVGEKRVGVALLRSSPRVAMALTTLERTAEDFWQQLSLLIKEHDVEKIVVGLPRGLDGQETDQTRTVQAFAEELQQHTNLPVIWQDEAMTSVTAESALQASGKPYTKGDIDATAAQLILSDYQESEAV